MVNRTDIIGQKDLLDRIDTLIDNGNFPRFSIIVGGPRSGKRLIANYISDRLNSTFVPSSVKIDDVRDVINSSYTVMESICYMWANADMMSVGAKNAVLKITEEPPMSSYFIMTLQTVENMLPTILSRGTTFNIQPYSNDEILEYANRRNYDLNDNKDIVLNMCSTPGELDILNSNNLNEFVGFTNKVLDFIGQASIANCLKLSNNFALKQGETDKYDIKLFLQCVMSLALSRYKETNDVKYNKLCISTCNILSEFRTSSVSKLAVLDKWLLSANDTMK